MRIMEVLSSLKMGALRWCVALLLLGIATGHLSGCATHSQIKSSDEEETSIEKSYQEAPPQAVPADTQTDAEESCGLKVVAVRLTSAGGLVDFRYRVIDPEKVSPFLSRNAKPYLIDEASGAKLSVPNMPKVGSLRAKGKPETDRVYFILFGNSRGLVKKGSRVSVVVGDFKVENLVVE